MHLIHEEKEPLFQLVTFRRNVLPNTATKRLFQKSKEHLSVLMFPRHKVTSASLPACLLLFVQKSTEGRAHWRQRWCHHCDHYCAVWCPIFDQASLRAGQNVCLHTARRNSDLPVLINTGPVFSGPKTVLRPPPQAHLSLCSDALQLIYRMSSLSQKYNHGLRIGKFVQILDPMVLLLLFCFTLI